MESFRTALKPQPAPFGIAHSAHTLLVGSCFTEHIGARLAACKFRTLTNPFGIVYNPVSIAACLKRLAENARPFGAGELFEHDGLWHSPEHHGRFSKPGMQETLDGLNAALHEAAVFLKKTDRLLLTLGTADVFESQQTGRVVANNHKLPAALFRERRLSVSETTDALAAMLQQLHDLNPGLRIVLSVSPVRHLRGGAVANQRSKATLILACEALVRQFDFAFYFPAYELLLDDLRDYRFYAADMIHPSETAVEYIWQFFSDTFFDDETKRLNMRIEKIAAAARHRPFKPDTEAHRAFARAQLEAIENLKKEWPGLDFGVEEEWFRGF
jgi:lysophospholipase L1-like esterase